MTSQADHERRRKKLRRKYPNGTTDPNGTWTARTDDAHDPTKQTHHDRFPTQTLSVPNAAKRPAILTIPLSPINEWFYGRAVAIPGVRILRPALDLELIAPLDEFPDRLEQLAGLFDRLVNPVSRSDPDWQNYLDTNWRWMARRTRDTLRVLARTVRGRRPKGSVTTATYTQLVADEDEDDSCDDPESPYYLYQRDLRNLPDRV